MTISLTIRALLALGVAGGCTLASRSLIHLFQLESYQFPGYRKSVQRNWRRSLAPGLMMTVLSVALLAAYSVRRGEGETLEDYLNDRVFAAAQSQRMEPRPEDAAGFAAFMERYKACLAVEKAAAVL